MRLAALRAQVQKLLDRGDLPGHPRSGLYLRQVAIARVQSNDFCRHRWMSNPQRLY